MKFLYCSLLFLLAYPLNAQPGTDSLSTRVLQPADMQADFRYLRRLLEETHPGLYRYTAKASMQAKLDSLDRSFTKPQSFYRFFKTVNGLLADIRCAHTHALPQKDWRTQFNKVQKTIPFFILPTQQHVFVLLNGTTDQTIKPGFELLSINGQSIADVRQQLYRQHWADGYIQSSKSQLRGEFFNLFYYWFIGQPDQFSLTFRSLTGDTLQVNAPAKPFSESLRQMIKNPVNKQMVAWYVNKRHKHPWRLSFPDTLANTAILRFDGFGGEGAKNGAEAITTFQAFMNKSLAKIEKQRIRHLIIDVRGNTGGWDSQGIELFTYLMKTDSAVPYYTRQHSITNGEGSSSEFLTFSDLSEADRQNAKNELTPEPDGTFTLKQDSGIDSTGRTPKRYAPKPNRFKGQVYVLMDGESASTASEFLAVAHANKVGVFIGTESGGAYEGGNGGSFITLDLPKSGMQVTTPLVYYNDAVPEPKQKGRGTLPDYNVPTTRTNILTHTDAQLNFVTKLIREQK
ncbi:S41 family peptidase [Spirosoma foliorum]|uniref:Peptidase S41 n=1 Tax=Spirosoma foliorum TaxID=2710596 RepID=A0A7G5GS84_9BACT|nr:S41 family peptidase [Spirosoma foliorum]QMW01726.1 peptidase S41 [Spirosoma foliorum]